MKITYHRIPSLIGIKVRNNNGIESSFGDTLAWSLFLQGAARVRGNGVDITVYDHHGVCLVGTVAQLVEHEAAVEQKP